MDLKNIYINSNTELASRKRTRAINKHVDSNDTTNHFAHDAIWEANSATLISRLLRERRPTRIGMCWLLANTHAVSHSFVSFSFIHIHTHSYITDSATLDNTPFRFNTRRNTTNTVWTSKVILISVALYGVVDVCCWEACICLRWFCWIGMGLSWRGTESLKLSYPSRE